MSVRPSWDRLIPLFAARRGAEHARVLSERVLLLSLLAVHVGRRSPTRVTAGDLEAFVASLPRSLRAAATDALVEFFAFAHADGLVRRDPARSLARRGRRSS